MVTPTPKQLDNVLHEKVQLALVLQPEFLVLLCQFGDDPWLMTPFQWHRVPTLKRTVQPSVWEQAMLEVVVMDSQTEQMYGSRNIALGPEFTASLCGAIGMQAAVKWVGENAYEHALERLLSKYPRAEKLLPLATARTLILP